MAISQEQNLNLLKQFGYTGNSVGQGEAIAYLTANPQYINSYEAARKQIEPEYNAGNLRTNAVAPTAVSPTLTQTMANTVNNPTAPAAGTMVPTLQTVQSNELQQVPAQQQQITAAAPAPISTTVAPVTTTTATAPAPVDPNTALAQISTANSTYNPTLTQDVGELQPEQMEVSSLATVRGQLEELMDFDAGNVPVWAKGALAKAESVLAARGLGASSIGAAAITAAIQQSALPIAAADAATYFQADLKNFDARQQASLLNFQTQQQNMLTDTAALNASKAFNATSSQQTQQFMANLVAQTQQFNASMVSSMEQFNAAEKNKVELTNQGNLLEATKFDAQIVASLNQFNSQQEALRQQFNSNMQFAVDQANVVWQRAVNTQNTATLNAAAATNAQNAFNMSQTALNNLWQAQQDALAWAMTATENQADRNYNMAMAANNYQYNKSLGDNDIWEVLGMFGMELAFS